LSSGGGGGGGVGGGWPKAATKESFHGKCHEMSVSSGGHRSMSARSGVERNGGAQGEGGNRETGAPRGLFKQQRGRGRVSLKK